MAKRDRRRWAARLDRAFFPFMGPAQIGIGRPEAPYEPPENPVCPMCGQPMAEHRVERTADQSHPTRLYCPPKPAG